MIRDATPGNDTAHSVPSAGAAVPGQARRRGEALAALRGSSVADRFCAWSGRSDRRSIFSVFPAGPAGDIDDLPLERGGVVLGVRRDARGTRHVLWSVAVGSGRLPDGLVSAFAALDREDDEVHLHLLAVGDRAREALVAELGFPRLALGRAPAAYCAATSLASSLSASMNPPDWRCQRSA